MPVIDTGGNPSDQERSMQVDWTEGREVDLSVEFVAGTGRSRIIVGLDRSDDFKLPLDASSVSPIETAGLITTGVLNETVQVTEGESVAGVRLSLSGVGQVVHVQRYFPNKDPLAQRILISNRFDLVRSFCSLNGALTLPPPPMVMSLKLVVAIATNADGTNSPLVQASRTGQTLTAVTSGTTWVVSVPAFQEVTALEFMWASA